MNQPEEVGKALRESIKVHEGFSDVPYDCPAGYLTCGWGHNLEAHFPNTFELMRGQTFSVNTCREWLDSDIKDATSSAKRSCRAFRVDFDSLPDWTQAGLVEMSFQMGSVRWPGLMKSLRNRDWAGAARQALDSKWFREDTPERAMEVAAWVANAKGKVKFVASDTSPVGYTTIHLDAG